MALISSGDLIARASSITAWPSWTLMPCASERFDALGVDMVEREAPVAAAVRAHQVGDLGGPARRVLGDSIAALEEIPAATGPHLVDQIEMRRQMRAAVEVEHDHRPVGRDEGVARRVVQAPDLHVGAVGGVAHVDRVADHDAGVVARGQLLRARGRDDTRASPPDPAAPGRAPATRRARAHPARGRRTSRGRADAPRCAGSWTDSRPRPLCLPVWSVRRRASMLRLQRCAAQLAGCGMFLCHKMRLLVRRTIGTERHGQDHRHPDRRRRQPGAQRGDPRRRQGGDRRLRHARDRLPRRLSRPDGEPVDAARASGTVGDPDHRRHDPRHQPGQADAHAGRQEDPGHDRRHRRDLPQPSPRWPGLPGRRRHAEERLSPAAERAERDHPAQDHRQRRRA